MAETVVDRSAYSTTVRSGEAFKTRTYPEQVNFKEDDGDWAAINRALESKSDGTVRPAAVDGDAVIPSKLTRPVVLEHDGRTVSFRLLGADVDSDRDVSGSKAEFDDALAGVDVAYKVRPNGLKETIELASAASQRSFSYDVRADSDLTAAIVGRDLVLKDAAGTERFRVAAPLAWDSAEPSETANALSLSVVKTADRQWRLTMKADDDWLDDPARVYPVTLDPDYFWIDGYMRFHGANQDCAMAGGSLAGQSRCALDLLQIGYGNNRPYKSVMRFDIASAIPSYAYATASRFLAWQPSSSINKAPVNSRLRTVTRDWDNTATWDVAKTGTAWTTKGGDTSTDPNLTGAPITIGSSGYWSYWPAPLAAVNGWIDGTVPNYGFQISTDTTYPNVINAYEFTSTDGAQQSWPALEVTWVPDVTAPTGLVATGPASPDLSFLGGDQALNVTVSAQDEESGVASFTLKRDGGIPVSTVSTTCPQGDCPESAEFAMPINTTPMVEGRHDLTLEARDGAGNVTSTTWPVWVDRTAPPILPPGGISYFDNAANRIILAWRTVADPVLADGSSPSLVNRYTVRSKVNTGAFSAWSDIDPERGLDLRGITAGDSIQVEVQAVDAAGNASPLRTQTIVAATPSFPTTPSTTFFEDDDEADYDDYVDPSPESSARQVRPRRPAKDKPKVPRQRKRPDGSDEPGCGSAGRIYHDSKADRVKTNSNGTTSTRTYPNTQFRATVRFGCSDDAGSLYDRVTFQLCVQVKFGDDWRDFSFRDDRKCVMQSVGGNDLGGYQSKLEVPHLCYPGTHDIAATLYMSLYKPGSNASDIPKQEVHRVSELANRTCNSGAAWRWIAGSTSSPSSLLGNRLFQAPADIPPGVRGFNGKRRGFEAHHIVPAEETADVADQAQALAYACPEVYPNRKLNGVWLRGSKLRAPDEANGTANPDYEALKPEGMRRAFHPSLNNRTSYFTWVRNQLQLAVSGGGAVCNSSQAESLIRGMNSTLSNKANKAQWE